MLRCLYFVIVFCMMFSHAVANDFTSEVCKTLHEEDFIELEKALGIEFSQVCINQKMRQEVIFEHILDMVKNEEVAELRQIAPYLKNIKNYQCDNVLTSLVRSNDIQTIKRSIENGAIKDLY